MPESTTATYQRDRNPHRRLRHAAWKGDLSLARQMIAKGASVEGTDGDNYTALLIAARWNRMEFVVYLIEGLNADMTKRNGEGDVRDRNRSAGCLWCSGASLTGCLCPHTVRVQPRQALRP